MTAEWNLKPERANRRDQRDIEEANQEEGQRLAENELGRANGRNHDLFERSDLALAHHGEGCQRDHQHQGQAADHSRYKEPAAAESGVIPGPRLQLDCGHRFYQLRSNAADAVLLIAPGKAKRDLRDVAGGDQRGIRVGRIDNNLQWRSLSLAQLLRKPGIDLDSNSAFSLLDQIAELAGAGELALHVEVWAGSEERDQ